MAKEIHENIKDELGLDSYKLCDSGIYSKEGVLTTSGNAKEILGQGREMYKDLSDEMYELYQMNKTMESVKAYDYIRMPNDLVEIPSKTMEQLSYEYADLFVKGKGEQYVKEHKIEVLEEILAFCMTNEFETFYLMIIKKKAFIYTIKYVN